MSKISNPCATVAISVLLALPCTANPSSVLATGDSLTVGYGGGRLANAFALADTDVSSDVLATGGLTVPQYLGYQRNPHNDALRDYVAEGLALDPDVVVLMLGTNDAYGFLDRQNEALQEYTNGMAIILDRLTTTDPHTAPRIVLATVLPILQNDTERDRVAALAVTDLINPYLRREAAMRGLDMMDTNRLIQEQPDWQDWYSDGIHLWADDAAGYDWLAGAVVDHVLALLETPTITADFDGDNDVDVADFLKWKQDFGTIVESAGAGAGADGNGDRIVDAADYVIWRDNLGATVGQEAVASVPEPATMMLLVAGLMLFIRGCAGSLVGQVTYPA